MKAKKLTKATIGLVLIVAIGLCIFLFTVEASVIGQLNAQPSHDNLEEVDYVDKNIPALLISH